MSDVDIDFRSDFIPNDIFKTATKASMIRNNELIKHNVGYYFQDIPIDPKTKLSAIPYDSAEQFGFFKIDMLSLNLLDNFESNREIDVLLKMKPNWDLLTDETVVSQLFQIHNSFDIVSKVRPTSVEELADVLALIRPAKRMLLDQYLNDTVTIRQQLYTPSNNGKYHFKKSHAISYALTIVLQLNLLEITMN